MKIRELSREELIEESFVDLTYAMLQETHETKTYPELVTEIENLLGLSKEDMKARLVQFYTDMNIDGRFLILGENRWGLREWYPVEQIEEESAPTVKARKKKAKVADDEDFDDMDLELEDELEFDDFDDADDDDEDEDDDASALIIPPVGDEEEEEEEVIDFDVDVDDDDDEVDVDVLVEDLDGNIIDDEEEEEDDLEDDLK
ncbi:DNA-directed RNA polymerase subunit delta [Planococcus glaciei]|uniref:DNA-directed RNA polymerase subunit delta n=1 Tax=Planococcus glaciei TaxID=459472 RepID=UPI00069FEA2D|nr:DNA-directed RNA polymerase subunit delta [Planococcus glaciei]KOF09521.1 DNA-directed RNA polymerase subunit delta [Planococcus glaciei]MBX0314214.1 DNA-directed RNA polymerase subunit delta [Planococcus glaciei]SDH90804.1 DNA-directed RNA polymerase subunit delta [Planococcus glaciei]